MTRWLFAAGGLAAIAVVAWFGVAGIGHQLWRAAWVVPLAVGIHATQLALSAQAWRNASGGGGPGFTTWWLVRWVREAVNSLLPVAQLGGNVVGVRLLVRAGVPLFRASAGVTVDLTLEAVSQAVFTLAGIAALAGTGVGRAMAPWLGAGGAILALAVTVLWVAHRLARLHLARALLSRLVRRLPSGWAQALRGLRGELLRLRRDRAALWRTALLHLLAWALGCGETALALAAMGQAMSWQAVVVVESLGMAARSAAFAVPGALGVQEGGFILVAGLFGVAPDTAIALSMVKRARELLVGVPGLLAWHWLELRRREAPT